MRSRGKKRKKNTDNICFHCNIFENSNTTAEKFNSEFRKVSVRSRWWEQRLCSMSRITWNGLTLNCGFTLIYKILTKASLAVSCISMLVHWPSRLYKYCDLNCTTNVAKVQISVATPTGKEKTSLYTIYVCSCFTVHIEKNLVKRMAFSLIRVKHNVYQQHSKTFKKWKKLIFSKTYHYSKMDVEIRMLSHAVTQVCSSHLQLSGISHKRKITVKWQMPSKLASKVKEYSHLWPHSLHKFLQAGMKLSELALGNVK